MSDCIDPPITIPTIRERYCCTVADARHILREANRAHIETYANETREVCTCGHDTWLAEGCDIHGKISYGAGFTEEEAYREAKWEICDRILEAMPDD